MTDEELIKGLTAKWEELKALTDQQRKNAKDLYTAAEETSFNCHASANQRHTLYKALRVLGYDPEATE